MNKIILSGNICQDIELNTYNKKSCVRNSIAVKRDFKNSKGEYDTDFFNITLWESKADFISKYAKKGSKILVSGRLTNNEYETENGEKKYSNEVQVDHIEILTSKKEDKTDPEEIFGDKLEVKEEDTSVDDFF